MNNKKTVIIGGVPQPVGGVTGFIYRLCIHLPNHIDSVIDLYSHSEKWTLPDVRLIHRKRGALNAIIWCLNSILSFLLARNIYFNFSGTKFLKLAAFIPKMPWQNWKLTLHHGELEKNNGLGRLERIGLHKMNRIGFIGQKQKSFYEKNNVITEALFSVVPFLPYAPPPKEAKSYDNSFLKSLKTIRNKHDKILLASGYPSAIYNHDWVLEYINKQENLNNVALILCLYGDDPENRREELRKSVDLNPNVYLYEFLQPDAFQEVLQIIDIYLRPNTIDSYGVAVGEAVSLGKIAIVSDACDRFDGAQIFSVGDKAKFYQLIDEALLKKSKPTQATQNHSIALCQDLLS